MASCTQNMTLNFVFLLNPTLCFLPQDIAYYQALSAERLQTEAARIPPSTLPSRELYEPGLEPSATAKLDDLQRSWETLKNVVGLPNAELFSPPGTDYWSDGLVK